MYNSLISAICLSFNLIVVEHAAEELKAIKVIGRCPVCGTKVWSGWKRCVRCHTPITGYDENSNSN